MQLSTPRTYNDAPAVRTTNHRDVFSNLSHEAQLRYNSLGAEVDFSRGDALFVEGQPSQCVYVVLSGRVKLSVTSRDGKTMIVRIAEAGDILGLSAAMNSAEYEVSAQAFEFCRIKAIRARDFVEFLKKYPDAAMIATQCILREHKMMFKDVCRLGLPTTVAGRLANLLLDWVHARPQPGHDGSRVTVTLTQEEIAGMTATSRETVSRVLQQFQRDKLISIKGASLTVLQLAALEQLAA